MYTILNMQDITDFIPPDSEDNGSSQSGGIAFSASLSDPATTWDFVVDDIHQTLNIQNFMPVIVFDENVPPLPTHSGTLVPATPSMNFTRNPTLANGTNWTTSGTLSGLIAFLNNANSFQMTFNNSALGSGFASQQTLMGYVQPGVQYSWAGYTFATGTISNIQSILQLTFLDINGNAIGGTISQTFTTPPPANLLHAQITGTAPAGAVFALVAVGGQSTVGGSNSGVLFWGSTQFEPMWFANKGVSYPTADCNFSQVNSVLMPDGTTSRACRLFAGYVENHINVYAGKQRHTAVQCASSSKLLETAGLISSSYTNTQDTSILSNAIAQLPANASIIGQIATGQQNQFAPSSTLINGVVVDSISFNNATLREVANGLTAQSGSIYYIDPYYYLWYVPPSFVGTVVSLSDNPDNVNSFPYHDFSVEYDSTNPLNVAKVVGSKQQAAAVTDTFSGNGSTTVFNLSEPPFTTHVVTVGGVNTRTGVDGVDNAKFGPSLTYKALINKQAQTIKFATAPAAGSNNVVVTYTYEDQVISQIIAADAVGQQRAQFWGLVSDSNITSTTAAKNRGLKELTDYAFPRIILTLSSLGIYIPVGGLILFTCASENMSSQPFVVQTVDADPQGGGVYRWNYTAGVYNPTLLDHIRNVHKAVKKTPTTANVDVIASIDVAIFDSFVINDSVVVNANGAPAQPPYVYGGPTALVLYGSSVADGTLTTANDMATAGGGVETSKTTTPTGTNVYCEVYSQGGSPASVAAIPATPTGHGWVYSPGASTIAAGNWSASLTFSGTALGTSDLTIRFFKYSSGVYTAIGTINKTGVVSAKTTYSFPATAMPSISLGAGDFIYVDLWLHDASNVSGNAPIIYESTSASTGVNGDMTVVTAGLTNATVGALYGFSAYA